MLLTTMFSFLKIKIKLSHTKMFFFQVSHHLDFKFQNLQTHSTRLSSEEEENKTSHDRIAPRLRSL